MVTDRWLVRPGATVRLHDRDADDTGEFHSRHDAEPATEALLDKLDILHELLYVDGRAAVLLVLQGMDTSGKDGAIRKLSRGIDLNGAEVTNFKAPVGDELRHDFLWRVHRRVPELGMVGIFNRSHYEDVLIVRVHNLVPPHVWERRYDQINDFERMLTENNVAVLKCFLHITRDEQKERLEARLNDPAKLWKFNPDDLKERAFWDEYQTAYEVALTRCSTDHAPWHIIPANKKWFRDYAITRLLVETLEGLDLRLPSPAIDPSSVKVI